MIYFMDYSDIPRNGYIHIIYYIYDMYQQACYTCIIMQQLPMKNTYANSIARPHMSLTSSAQVSFSSILCIFSQLMDWLACRTLALDIIAVLASVICPRPMSFKPPSDSDLPIAMVALFVGFERSIMKMKWLVHLSVVIMEEK